MMKTFMVVAACFALLSLAARSARAQCCGEGFTFHAQCGNHCGEMFVFTCDEGAGSTFFAQVLAQCGSGTGCNNFEEYAPAGGCDVSPRPSVTQDNLSTSGENSVYVNAYVRACGGQYVATRVAMARQAG